jgi:hypothetical protein
LFVVLFVVVDGIFFVWFLFKMTLSVMHLDSRHLQRGLGILRLEGSGFYYQEE